MTHVLAVILAGPKIFGHWLSSILALLIRAYRYFIPWRTSFAKYSFEAFTAIGYCSILMFPEALKVPFPQSALDILNSGLIVYELFPGVICNYIPFSSRILAINSIAHQSTSVSLHRVS